MALIGLTMHRDFYAGRRRRDFLCFYTNVSNMAVLVYFGLIAPRLYAVPPLHPLITHMEFAVMMCIMLTCCVFHLMLYPAIRLATRHMPRTRDYYIVYTDNLVIHYLVPLTVFFYWLLCSPQKHKLTAADAFYWTVLPLGYTAWILLRARKKRIIAETDSPYPYPFLDIAALGAKRVMQICAGLYVLCILTGLLVIVPVHLLAS